MRAIGASDGDVGRVVLAEGVVIGGLSWALGTVVAHPLGRLLSDAVGGAFLNAPLRYTYSVAGAGAWLITVLVLATLASLLPARSATRISVREALAYE
jgi:putative ABC transport system permease protein